MIELELNDCFQLAISISTYFSLQDSIHIDILFAYIFFPLPSLHPSGYFSVSMLVNKGGKKGKSRWESNSGHWFELPVL